MVCMYVTWLFAVSINACLCTGIKHESWTAGCFVMQRIIIAFLVDPYH